jgi:hypothetical protein
MTSKTRLYVCFYKSTRYFMSKQDLSPFVNCYVVCKFFMSKAPNGTVNCISRTLGKFGIIEKNTNKKVEHQDIWVCKIVREIKPGSNHGAFVLRPLEKISPDDLRKLIPGFYEVQEACGGKAAFAIPNTEPMQFWMLSRTTRQIFSKKNYAVVVPIQYQEKQVIGSV